MNGLTRVRTVRVLSEVVRAGGGTAESGSVGIGKVRGLLRALGWFGGLSN